MNRRSLLRILIAGASALGSGVLSWVGRAQNMMNPSAGGMMGHGMMGPMRTGMALFSYHAEVRRKVTFLSDGVHAVTESDNPAVIALIREHVASMYERLDRDHPFAYPMSRTVPSLFRNASGYHRRLQMTSKGVVVTETASDPDVVKLLHAHAREISGFVVDGMPAMMREMMR